MPQVIIQKFGPGGTTQVVQTCSFPAVPDIPIADGDGAACEDPIVKSVTVAIDDTTSMIVNFTQAELDAVGNY